MCEQSSVSYNHGDVVWVKLGPCWWPGEVVSFEELPSDITESFKKAPLAVVKFFDEEKYEFVRQLTHIHLYNSSKKYDFIKKGLDLHRAKHSFMDKFPVDVCTAETKTGGDPNILNDPRLGPDKRPNYSSIFGSPVPKKGSKESPSRGRGRGSSGKSHSTSNSAKKMSSLITHPRFLGKDDSQIRILVQTPSVTKLPETEYECYTCGFKSTRIEVIVLHNKTHLRGIKTPLSSPKKAKKTPTKRSNKKRLPTSKTSTIDEDLALLKQGLPVCSDYTSSDEDSSDSDEEPLIKRKTKSKTATKSKKIKSTNIPEVKKQSDIRTDLLAEWDDDDDEEEESVAERLSPKPIVQTEESKNDVDVSKPEEKNKSCFDFVDDEDDIFVPRVIPPRDKRKSTQDLETDENETNVISGCSTLKNNEDNVIESVTEKPKEKTSIENHGKEDEIIISKKRESQFQLEFEAFNNALKETTVPEVLDIAPVHKFEQNFHNVKTIKFPDKSGEESNISKEISSPSNTETVDKSEESKLLESSEVEFTTETITEPVKEPLEKSTEIATKLTNPKKRFVKTFENETKNSSVKEPSVQEKKEESGLEPLQNELKSLKVAKLKTQLMKKLVDASSKKETLKQVEKTKKIIHKNRRLKTFTEITKIESAESKDHKRSISESDNETETHVKKKRYSLESENNDAKNKQSTTETTNTNLETQETQSILTDVAKDRIEDPKNSITVKDNITEDKTENQKKSFTEPISTGHLEYLNSSPTKIFSELHVDKDELLDANSLSESQKLTIQNIIGVSSPILSIQQPLTSKTETEKTKTEIVHHLENVMELQHIVEKEKEETISEKNEINQKDAENICDKSCDQIVNVEKAVDETTTDVIDQSAQGIIEEKIEQITASDTIFEISETLAKDISDKLPDEIIERQSEEAVEITKNNFYDKTLTTTIETSIQEHIEKPPIETEILMEKKYDEHIKESFEEEEEFKKQIEEKLKDESINSGENKYCKSTESNLDTKMELKAEKSKQKYDRSPGNVVVEKQDDIRNEPLTNVESNIKKDLQMISEPMGKNKSELVKSLFHEEEMVNIEGNLTVVTETDLADKQVEIATTPEVSKPITLASFSMDFCEDVESYVKAETIMHNFSELKDSVTIEEKSQLKGETQKKAFSQSSEAANTINDQKTGNIDIRYEKTDSYERQIEKKKKRSESEKLTIDFQNNENIRSGKTKFKKFDDIITPAKEEPPTIIMEGFEESIKDDVPENNVAIDQTNLKVQTIPKEDVESNSTLSEITEKITNEENVKYHEIELGSLYKEQTTQEIIKEISQKEEIIIPPMDISVESEVAKITDSIIEQEVVLQDNHHSTSSTKLLEILTDKPKSNINKGLSVSPTASQNDETVFTTSIKASYKHKFITKQATPGPSRTPKATILSDKIIKPLDESKTVSVKKVTSKRSYQDVEDIDTYIIQKPLKKINVSVEPDILPKIIKKTPIISKGKARILQQTIITPTGDILQPPVSQQQTDDNMFDINSMPIVLSDQILTPETIENMQIVLQENTTTKTQINPIKKPITQQQVKLLNKIQPPTNVSIKETILKNPIPKSYPANKQKMQKVYPSSSAKILKNNTSVITQPGKQGKFIIVPATTTATGSKYTVGKRPTIVKKTPQKIVTPISKVSDSPITSGGNKIMILKSQGQQQKILLSTQQKQLPPAKFKGRPLTGQKQIIAKESPQSKGANIISQTIVNSKGQITTLPNQSSLGNRGQIITSMAQQNKNIKIDPTKIKRPQQRVYIQSEITKPSTSGQQRTIIIKNPQGQTVKKIQGTDNALLDQQVAEQLQAISRASANQLKDMSPKISAKIPPKKPYLKKQEQIKTPVTKSIIQNTQTTNKNVSVPPLAPISPVKKVETQYTESNELTIIEEKSDEIKRAPHQLVIQDAQGNQTTITEGQILALPSEAIDGQPHSYVLVTLDETGNLTPLNSEALMSLDPNLNLTSDLGNMVLQIDQGSTSENETQTVETPQRTVTEQLEKPNSQNLLKESANKTPVENVLLTEASNTETGEQNVQAVINSREMGQLIITGDAATAQKFLESLAEGNADLANLLANAEGNVLIQADGQQILINADSENSMLVMNSENINNENNESSGNPIFASQPVKNQDILAAALADTDVFQQDQSVSHSPSKVAQSQLSPNSALYPINVGNVLETNSMSSPIMTPLEVPSTNSKKIDDENAILNQVPKNVDLPITITDPNISQTVAQQQVASLIATELPTNLDLPLAIQDPGISVTSAEMSSPSFVYSLPALDDTVDINQKAFGGSISMPLLTEEPEDSIPENSNSVNALEKEITKSKTKVKSDSKKSTEENGKSSKESGNKSSSKQDESNDKKTDFIGSGGLCAMRGGICNSLSEPPPDMFDFSVENQPYETSHITQAADLDIPMNSTPSSEVSNTINDRESNPSSAEEKKNDDATLYSVNTTSPSTNTDDSCEFPVQPPIIAKPFEENGTSDSRFNEEDKMATDGDV